jgi:hypothetical protein
LEKGIAAKERKEHKKESQAARMAKANRPFLFSAFVFFVLFCGYSS